MEDKAKVKKEAENTKRDIANKIMEKQERVDKEKKEIRDLHTQWKRLSSGNENQPFMCVLVMIFVEAHGEILIFEILHYRRSLGG